MTTSADKSMLYFIENLLFCIREMLGLYDANDLVLRVTPEAKERIDEWMLQQISAIDIDFRPKCLYELETKECLYGVEIEVCENVDSNLGFEVCKNGA